MLELLILRPSCFDFSSFNIGQTHRWPIWEKNTGCVYRQLSRIPQGHTALIGSFHSQAHTLFLFLTFILRWWAAYNKEWIFYKEPQTFIILHKIMIATLLRPHLPWWGWAGGVFYLFLKYFASSFLFLMPNKKKVTLFSSYFSKYIYCCLKIPVKSAMFCHSVL